MEQNKRKMTDRRKSILILIQSTIELSESGLRVGIANAGKFESRRY